jgi:membrane-bound lytic murein transglycosylase F
MRPVLIIALLLMCSGCSEEQLLAPLAPGAELVVLTRNSPTTYYFDSERPTGFEYQLLREFAGRHDLKLRIKVAFTLEELIEGLAAGEAHIAAAGLSSTAARQQRFLASQPYLRQKALVIYKSGLRRPRQEEDLAGRDIVVLAGSSHVDALRELQQTIPEIQWREIRAADSLELMQLVADEKAELAIVDSTEFKVQQRLYPRLVAALSLDATEDIVWYLPRLPGAEDWRNKVNGFIAEIEASGELRRLQQQYFDITDSANRMASFTFQRQMQTRLPEWQGLIEEVAIEYQMDWRLLAAIAYQESHWNPRARSPTGVRGMMMITQATAKDLGISNRMDPRQSLRGGARFLKNLLRRLPADIDEPDRTWMALAAYNIGMGHLEDARVLTERAGLDPHLWEDVRGKLPGLQDPKIYPTVRYGFARGREAVTYVDNIRHYFSALKLSDLDRQRIQPPVQAAELLPDAAANYSPVTL